MINSLFCPIRKTWVLALPEEMVRQHLIQEMIQHLGYPLGSLVLEKGLNQLPHLQNTPSLPKRRIDLIVLAKGLHPQHTFYPLLLIECKAIPLSEKTLRQIVGYNRYIGAPFISAVNQTQVYTGWYHPSAKNFIFKEHLFHYDVLLKQARFTVQPEKGS